MSTYGTEPISLPQAADLSASQFLLCKLGTSGVSAVSATTDEVYGVICTPSTGSTTGLPVGVQRYGVAKVTASKAITRGSKLYATAAGKVTDTPVLGSRLVGVAVEAATGDGSVIGVELDVNKLPVPAVVYQFPVTLAAADNADVAKFTPGFVGRLLSLSAMVTTATGDASGKQAILNAEVGTTDVTGGVVTIDTDVVAADPDTISKVIDGTAITALNTFDADDVISIEAANTTPFTSGVVLVTATCLMG